MYLQGTRNAEHVFFETCEYVRVSVTVQTSSLRSRRYNEHQLQLLREVVRMRDIQKLTFRAIARKLNDKGLVSPRGKQLSEELVFSMYKKRPAG